jgi:hypothetical protein
VSRDRRRDLDHLQEGDRALLHARATRHRCCQQRQALDGSPLDGHHEPFGRRDADRAGEERELAGEHGHPPAVDASLAGDHRLVQAAALAGARELAGVGLVGVHWHGGCVPPDEGAVVQGDVEQPLGAQPGRAHGYLLAIGDGSRVV